METAAGATWDDLRVLLALHRHRSFLAAGRALGVSTSTASRRIEQLEHSLGRTLVRRSSVGTSLEPNAIELVALAEQLELGLDAIRRNEVDDATGGTVRVSMGEGFVRGVTQVLSELRRRHPALMIEVVSDARLLDLARREADIGIRKVRSSSRVLIERPAGRLSFALFAASSYVERRLRGGVLQHGELARHDFIGYEGPNARLPQAKWLAARGATRFVFRSNSDFAIQEATLQGQGIAVLAEAQARGVPELVRLDLGADVPPVPAPTVYLAFHREHRRVPRIRLVVDALESALRRALA